MRHKYRCKGCRRAAYSVLCHRCGRPMEPYAEPAQESAAEPDYLTLLGQMADLRRRLQLIADLTATLPSTWPELYEVIRTVRTISAD